MVPGRSPIELRSSTEPLAASATHRAIDAVWRIGSARLIAGLTRIVRDVSVAEDLAQDALVAALEQWPESGIPDNPGAWLMAAAKHRGIDALRRRVTLERKQELIGRELQILGQLDQPDLAAQVDDVQDDILRLVFMTCHPVLSREARVALTLRLLGGLSTPEIARAFLVSEGTVAQRIVRAKRTLAQARVPFEVPARDELADRLSAVLEVIYLVFNEGYAATAGDALVRDDLAVEAIRLARVVQSLLPEEPEPAGLLALMLLQHSRSAARVDEAGGLVLLEEQDRTRWDSAAIAEALPLVDRALTSRRSPGPYALQAAIAAVHAGAARADATDWCQIALLYAELANVLPSPVVTLNRAVAIAMADGPAAGLALIDALARGGALDDYHLLHAARADLLRRAGRRGVQAGACARDERGREPLPHRAHRRVRAVRPQPDSSARAAYAAAEARASERGAIASTCSRRSRTSGSSPSASARSHAARHSVARSVRASACASRDHADADSGASAVASSHADTSAPVSPARCATSARSSRPCSVGAIAHARSSASRAPARSKRRSRSRPSRSSAEASRGARSTSHSAASSACESEPMSS